MLAGEQGPVALAGLSHGRQRLECCVLVVQSTNLCLEHLYLMLHGRPLAGPLLAGAVHGCLYPLHLLPRMLPSRFEALAVRHPSLHEERQLLAKQVDDFKERVLRCSGVS